MALQMINKKMEYEQFKAMFEFNMEGELRRRKGSQIVCTDEMQKFV